MDGYLHKSKYSNFPKLQSNTSTWYKTFNLDKSKNNSMKNLHSPHLSFLKDKKNNKINKNSSQIFSKIKNKNHSKYFTRNSPLSLLHYNLSDEETDDSIFALSQIKNIDDLISRRVNKTKIWKTKQQKIYDIEASNNYKIIKKIKESINKNRFRDSLIFSLRNEINKKQYFPVRKVEVIREASDIMGRMEKQRQSEKKFAKHFFKSKRVDINEFARHNREICLRNNVIKYKKDVRGNLRKKEKNIIKALEDANNGLNRDEKSFKEFVENNKQKIKEDLLLIENMMEHNMALKDKIDKLNTEIKNKQDEIRRMIKNIELYYSYAKFAHRIVSDKSIKEVNLDKLNFYKNKIEGKDINYVIQNVFDEFDFLLNDNDINNNENDFDFDDVKLTYVFNSIEDSIIKCMEERDDIIKELERGYNYSELEYLHNRIIYHKNELKYLDEEKNKINSLNIKLNDDYKIKLHGAQNHICEIYDELKKLVNIRQSKNDNINKDDIILEAKNLLYLIENKIISYINEIEKLNENGLENDELFKKIIENVKTENKYKKMIESRKILEKKEEEKKMKYNQRMNAIKLKTIYQFTPTWIHQQKKKEIIEQKKNEGNHDEDLLCY